MPILPPRALLLAPMVELSHRPLRELVASFGSCDRYYTEMTSASGYLACSPFDRWFMDCEPVPETTVVQLFDSEIEPLAKAAARLSRERSAAGRELGGLDANFGCSAPHIERSGGGVSWMKDTGKAAALISAMKEAAPGVVVSAKLRLGYEESGAALIGFCRALADAGADYLVIHPRLKSQKFRRSGKWDYVKAVAEALPIPIVGNGDVRDYDSYASAVGRYGTAGAMIGREAVRRPWIFALIRGKEADPGFEMRIEVEETGLSMIRLIRELLPLPFHASRVRRFFFYYCDNLAFGHHLRYAIQNSAGLDDAERLFRAYFDEVPSERVKIER
ncbi:MAG: tRNA-dihydrouridine synthase family protein [Spirochaetes bacterium]|nr:tRNA-dihydrouridine synthase family protein [Spirochaetota bacterium]MBU1079138.1 tRNA-dihydrouridine synthase family protein [Spirochaetota bacterium]